MGVSTLLSCAVLLDVNHQPHPLLCNVSSVVTTLLLEVAGVIH